MPGAVALFWSCYHCLRLSTELAVDGFAGYYWGAADMVSMVFRGAYVHCDPDAMRAGRGGQWLFIGASNQLGRFESGVTAAWFGAVPAIVIGGVGTLLVVGCGAMV